MVSFCMQSLTAVSVGNAGFEPQLLTDEGKFWPDDTNKIDKAQKMILEMCKPISTAGEFCADVVLRSVQHCALWAPLTSAI
jgi:hypothetical protein